MLALPLAQEECDKLYEDAAAGKEIEVDLENSVVRRPNGEEIPFQVDAFRRHCLLNGLDDIGLTLQHKDLIEKFEEKRSEVWPWLDGIGYAKKGQKITPVATKASKKAATEW